MAPRLRTLPVLALALAIAGCGDATDSAPAENPAGQPSVGATTPAPAMPTGVEAAPVNAGTASEDVRQWFEANCPTEVAIDPKSDQPFLVQGAVKFPATSSNNLYRLDQATMKVTPYRNVTHDEYFCLSYDKSEPLEGTDDRYDPPGKNMYSWLSGPDTEGDTYVVTGSVSRMVSLLPDASDTDGKRKWVLDPASFPMNNALEVAETADPCVLVSCGG